MENFRSKSSDLERYIQIVGLQDRNETLFYRVVMDNLEEMMPIIYTPTVGRACQEFGHIFRRSRGILYFQQDRGQMETSPAQLADARRESHRRHRRRTHSRPRRSRRFGHGHSHRQTLALHRAAPEFIRRNACPSRLTSAPTTKRFWRIRFTPACGKNGFAARAYDALIEEFMVAVGKIFPGVLVQFEDFGNRNAFRLLEKYRDRACTFNDDIQGTGAVALAGILSALRITGGKMADQRMLLLGAGEAGMGIADNIVNVLVEEGLSLAEARKRCWFVDSKGLVVKGRDQLNEHKLHFAHDHAPCADLFSAVKSLKPTMLIGASGQAKTFTHEIVTAMASSHERPVIFALSNPTSKAECTAEEAYIWTGGRAVFASGSPFAPVTVGGKLSCRDRETTPTFSPALVWASFAPARDG